MWAGHCLYLPGWVGALSAVGGLGAEDYAEGGVGYSLYVRDDSMAIASCVRLRLKRAPTEVRKIAQKRFWTKRSFQVAEDHFMFRLDGRMRQRCSSQKGILWLEKVAIVGRRGRGNGRRSMRQQTRHGRGVTLLLFLACFSDAKIHVPRSHIIDLLQMVLVFVLVLP